MSRSGRGRRIYGSKGPEKDRPRAQPFIISDDDTSLSIPACHGVPRGMRDPQLLEDFKSSLKVIGFYSEDKDKNFHDDCSNLRFIDKSKIPDIGSKTKSIDLNLDVDSFESTEMYSGTTRKCFLNMLNWIYRHEDLVRKELGLEEDIAAAQVEKLGPDFICPKNVLSQIFMIPYFFGSEVKFYASSINNTVYLLKEFTPQAHDGPHETHIYSHKFKDHMCGMDLKEWTFQNVDFRCMLKGMLGPYSLLYSASTDCADPEIYREDAKDLSAFYKLASCREIQENSTRNFARRALRIYLNCLMTTTPKAIVGFKKEPTFINLLKLYEQEDLKKLILDESWYFDPIFAIIYAIRILTYVKFRTEMEPGVVFSFTRKSKDPFIVSQKEEELGSILPKWFEERHEVH